MKTMLSIWSPPPASSGYRNMRSRVDDPIRLEPEQTLSKFLSSLSGRCTFADDAANVVPPDVGSRASFDVGNCRRPENPDGLPSGLSLPTLNRRALPRLTATLVSRFRLASLVPRAWFAVAQGC